LAQARLSPLSRRGWAAEIFLEEEAEREVSWAEGRAKDFSSSGGVGASVRVLKGGRQGFSSGTDLSLRGIKLLFERAVVSAQPISPHEARRLPGGNGKSSTFGIFEPSIFSRSEKSLLQQLKSLERRALGGDRRLKKVLNLSFFEASGVQAIVNTHGISVAEPWSAVSFGMELLGKFQKETETCGGSVERRSWGDLNPVSVVDEVRGRLLRSFNARPLRSGPWPVIFPPRVGIDLVELFSQTVLADAVQKGRSCLAGRLTKKIVSPLVTFVDDGTLLGGLASGRWDDEGNPKQRTVVVESGILRSFLHDTVTAGRTSGTSTGNAFRPGREIPPSPGVTNFYLAGGPLTPDDLYRSTDRAFVVQDLIGMHTADPVSGDFSVGASGSLLEKGRLGRAVRGVTLSGNVLELLSRVDAVANDLTWQGTFGSPTFRVKELSVGGSS
jgi:PmbA protein